MDSPNASRPRIDPRPVPPPPVDPAGVSPSYWDFGDDKEDPIHRIHAYPAKFPAFITTKALHYAVDQGVDVNRIADVFCGCGTTAVEAIRNGKDFWGCDINPVATLIAQVKTRCYNDHSLRRKFSAIMDYFAVTDPSPHEIASVPDRITYWFDDEAIDPLLRLRKAINVCAPLRSPYRSFFLCAFSNILKPTSNWLTKSIKPQLDPNKEPRDVEEAFTAQVALMLKANSDRLAPSPGDQEPVNHATSTSEVHIRTRNFLAPGLPKCRPDLIVTSPPYVTSYSYADIHQLSALWLGYAADYRDLRQHMLGNEYRVKSLGPSKIKALGPLAADTYKALTAVDAQKARSVARYFYDMNRAVKKCWQLLNRNGMAVFVIGNTRYQQTTIDNRQHLEHCMAVANFHDIQAFRRKVSLKIMTPYRDERGRFTRKSGSRQVYGEEFVVTGRRR